MSARQLDLISHLSTLSAEDSPARTSRRPALAKDFPVRAAVWRSNSSASSTKCSLDWLLLKIPGTVGGRGCPNCGAPCGPEDMPRCRFECAPVMLARPISERDVFSSPTDYHLASGDRQALGLYPTPTAQTYGSQRALTGAARPSLDTMARRGMLPTPVARDGQCRKSGPGAEKRNSLPLSERAGGRLHPRFVEWMMGFPDGWTEID